MRRGRQLPQSRGCHPTGLRPGTSVVSLCVLLLSCATARSHEAQRSFSDIKAKADGVSVIFDIDPADFSGELRSRFDRDADGRIRASEMRRRLPQLARRVRDGFRVYRGGKACAGDLRRQRVSEAAGMARVVLWYACPATGNLVIEVPLLERMDRQHVHMLSVRLPDGMAGGPLTPGDATWRQAPAASGLRSFGRYARMGVHHIITGYDHLLFLLALLLPLQGLAQLIWVVTAFAIGHSLTLSASALGVPMPPAWLVEPLIALSIAYAAFENLRGWTGLRRTLAVASVGLIHGIGFGGMLLELGLPRQHQWVALGGFNLGVELGQLMVLAVAYPLLASLRSRGMSRLRTLGLWVGALGVGVAVMLLALPLGLGFLLLITLLWLAAARRGYEHGVLRWGSWGLALTGVVWFFMRVLAPAPQTEITTPRPAEVAERFPWRMHATRALPGLTGASDAAAGASRSWRVVSPHLRPQTQPRR